MPQAQNEVEKFFENLPSQDKQMADVFNDKKPPEEGAKVETPAKEDTTEETEGRKNRRHRRLEEQLQRERESNIALNERLKVLAEQDRVVKESNGEIDPRLIRVFGSDTPEKLEVAKHFSDLLEETRQSAREEALREIDSRSAQEDSEVTKYENIIGNELESLEDTYNVDLTSDGEKATNLRKEFLTFVQDLSPKDESGAVKELADFGTAFELYQKLHEEPKIDNSRQREVASKSMQRSGQNGTQTQKAITKGFDGWKKDFGID